MLFGEEFILENYDLDDIPLLARNGNYEAIQIIAKEHNAFICERCGGKGVDKDECYGDLEYQDDIEIDLDEAMDCYYCGGRGYYTDDDEY